MKTIRIQLAAVAIVLAAALPATAGVGGSAAKIRPAVASGSVDAIVAEVERAEALACEACVQLVTNLTEDPLATPCARSQPGGSPSARP